MRVAIEFMAGTLPAAGAPADAAGRRVRARIPYVAGGRSPQAGAGAGRTSSAAYAAAGTARRAGPSSPGRSTTISPGARCSSHATSAAVKPAAPSGAAATTIWS